MDDLETIIKELRVDWENVLSSAFNPLHYALSINRSSSVSTDFRDMFHKLEFAMEKIITVNYKGFSDSVLSYNEFNKLNRNAIKSLETIIKIAREVKDEDFEIKDIASEKDLARFCKIKYDICTDLQLIKQTLDEFNSTEDTFKKSHMITECLDLIDNKNYVKIKGVDEYRKIIYAKYLGLAGEVNLRLCDFVFKNRMEDIHYFRALVTLGSLHELELCFQKNFREMLFNAVESTIVSLYMASTVKLEELARSVMKKIESIKNNMAILIAKINQRFAKDPNSGDFIEMNNSKLPNYFGRRENSFKFCSDLTFVTEILKEELSSFISKYSSYSSGAELSFDLGCVIDDINYNQIYGSEHPMAARLSAENKFVGSRNSGHSMVVAPSADLVLYLLKHSSDFIFKSYLNAKVEGSYDKHQLENGMQKMEAVLAESRIKIDSKTQKLAFYEVVYSLIGKESNDHRTPLKRYINSKVYALLLDEYKNTFTAEIIHQCVPLPCSDPDTEGENFRDLLTKRYINKKDLFLTRQKYQKAFAVVNTLRSLNALLFTQEMRELYRIYFDSLKYQLNLDFFYFYDLMYRQGNHRFYMKNIVRVLGLIYEEARTSIYFEGLYGNLEFYSKCCAGELCVRNREDLDRFVEYLRILDDIMGELEFHSSLGGLYKFYKDVADGICEDENGKRLMARLR